MAQYFAIHPTHPQLRLVRRAAQIVRDGGLIAYPTDSCYALGCHLGDALDALMVVDLAAVDPTILARYFGRGAADAFLAHHTAASPSRAA